MRLKADTTCKEDLQAGRAWGALGFKLADEIDRAMTSADGLAALSRAADLVALADATNEYTVLLCQDENGVPHVEINDNYSYLIEVLEPKVFSGPDAIAEAAAWVRQRGGAG
jgi:hypothetical protein